MIDLHIHSICSSDGEEPPAELAVRCLAHGIQAFAVADHNSVRANNRAQHAASVLGLTCIPAIEIDCTFEGTDFHLLGYGIDNESGDFTILEEDLHEQVLAASKICLEKVRKLGFDVEEAQLEALCAPESRGIWTGEMFAEVLLKDSAYTDNLLLAPYRAGGSRGGNPYVNFDLDYFSKGKPCHADLSCPCLQTAIDMIHQNHGAAVLAHPAVNLGGKSGKIEEICALPIDGLEAMSSYHSPDETAYYTEAALRHNLVLTCGSDFHGKCRPSIEVGTGCRESDDLLDPLLARISWYR